MGKSVIFIVLFLFSLTSGQTVNVDVIDKKNASIARISQPAPFWKAKGILGDKIQDFKSTDFKDKYLVFFFYPLDFTFVCPTEITAFSDRMKEFRDLNAAVVGCSVDSEYTHLAWVNTARHEGGIGRVEFPLISDLTHEISKAYGVYMDNLGHTLRALFIIDKEGIIRQITINDLQVGRSVDEILRLLQAYNYTDEHKEVCPAGWKPGDATIKPDPDAKKKYFKNKN